jgi:ParB/RepB/Spo0J family partition protein
LNSPEPLQESLVDYFPIDKLHASPTNPREAIGDVSELATSIARMGVLQPILIRPARVPGEYELISGHRRLVAAAEAGLEQVPCRLCEVNDEQVAEIQIVENLQRKDLSPMEEARGYERLQSEFGHSAEQIAGRVGKSRAYVYAKLKLLALHQAGREALAARQITESIALLVARIPGEDLQAKAVDRLTEQTYQRDAESESMSFRDAQRVLRQSFTTDLRKAIWKLDDERLVADVGSCQACPTRSGNNRELYADVEDERMCMNPTCYSIKREAQLARLLAQAEKKGKVVPETLAQRNLGYSGLVYNSDFVELSATAPGGNRTWAQLAKSAGIEVEREVIVDKANGKNLIVARGEQLKEALRAAGVPPVDPLDVDDDEADSPFDAQFEAYEKANRTIAAASIDKLIDSPAVWAAVAEKMLVVSARVQMDVANMACLPEVVEFATGWQTGARDLVEAVKDPRMLRRLIAAAALLGKAAGTVDEELSDEKQEQYVFRSPDFDAALDQVGIDAPAMRARILAESKAESVSDPSEAARAADQTAEPAAPAKPKRARKAKAPKVATEETPEQAGSAGVDEGAEVTHG